MHINILSKVSMQASETQIYDAIAVEVALINHCRANITPYIDNGRNAKYRLIEETALARYEILMEIIS